MFPLTLMRLASPWVLGAALGLGLATTASAISDTQFQNAFSRFVQAGAGDSAAIDAAAQAFQDLVKIEPANPVLYAYAGAATAAAGGQQLAALEENVPGRRRPGRAGQGAGLLSPAHEALVQNGTRLVYWK